MRLTPPTFCPSGESVSQDTGGRKKAIVGEFREPLLQLTARPSRLSVYPPFPAQLSWDWIELIIRAPTPLTEDISVYHYPKPVRLDVKNTIGRL